MRRLAAALAGLALALNTVAAVAADQVTVFAAASLTNALNEIAERFAAAGQGTVRLSYAASSGLARQIENGAPADLFVSADQQWMDYLAARRLVEPATRVNLAGNTLVLVAPSDSALGEVRIGPGTAIAALAGGGRIATGDPDHVPVGRYAREACQALGQWREVDPRLARADSARSALALVERGEAPLGIVYATDAAASKRVKVVGTFPDRLHAPIVYPAALVAGRATPAARAFLAYLSGPEARAVLARHGFKP